MAEAMTKQRTSSHRRGVMGAPAAVSSALVRMHYSFPPKYNWPVKSGNISELARDRGRTGEVPQNRFVRYFLKKRSRCLKANSP